MKLDKEFQERFLSYLNNLSKDEFLNIVDNPTVNVDFIPSVFLSKSIDELYNCLSSVKYTDSILFLDERINFISNVSYTRSPECKLELFGFFSSRFDLMNLSKDEEYETAANDALYALAA